MYDTGILPYYNEKGKRKNALPFGEGAEQSEAGEGSAGLPNFHALRRLQPHLFRHGLRRATFPKGEGIGQCVTERNQDALGYRLPSCALPAGASRNDTWVVPYGEFRYRAQSGCARLPSAFVRTACQGSLTKSSKIIQIQPIDFFSTLWYSVLSTQGQRVLRN